MKVDSVKLLHGAQVPGKSPLTWLKIGMDVSFNDLEMEIQGPFLVIKNSFGTTVTSITNILYATVVPPKPEEKSQVKGKP